MTSSMIYYSTHARQNEIYLLNINFSCKISAVVAMVLWEAQKITALSVVKPLMVVLLRRVCSRGSG